MSLKPPRTTRPGERAFRALLLLYPAAFRDEYGREMAIVFADRYRRASGPFDRLRLWVEALTGVAIEAPKEHARMTLHDLRYACRRLRLSPGFAATSIATLALAIGASTAMFSVLNAVLLRPLPYTDPDRLAMLWTEVPSQGVRGGRSAYGSVEQWRQQSRSFADLAVVDPISATLTRGDDREQISVARVSPNLFSLLGIRPVRGRTFSIDEARDRKRLAVISDRFWQSRFAGADDAVGASIEIDGMPSQIIGVLPASLQDADVWEPHTLFPDWETRRVASGRGGWFVYGRLRADVTFAQAQEEMNTISARLDAERPPAAPPRSVSVMPLDLHVTGAEQRLVLWMLTGAAVCLLLVGIANVAGLSLARSVGRVPEMAIRTALGASRARIVRQLAADGIAIAAASGALGLLVAMAGIGAARAFGPASLARLQEVDLDLYVFAWACAVSMIAGLVVGLAPVISTWRVDLRAAGAEGGRGITGGVATRLRRVLVVAECAVAIVLLVGAGLLVRSWWNLMRVDPGFTTEQVLSLSVATPSSSQGAQRMDLYDRVLGEVAALPGIHGAAFASELFIGNVSDRAITVEGLDGIVTSLVPYRSDEISPGFFAAMGTPLRAGRLFTGEDRSDAPPVAIINEAMANRMWPGRDPVGRRFAFGPQAPGLLWVTVVGIAANMRRQGLDTEPVPQVFQPLAQNTPGRAILLVRASNGDPLQLAAPIRAAVRRVDPRALVYRVETVTGRIDTSLAQRRLQTSLVIGFSAAALLLATIGIYGLIQYSVAARTHEIGIRMALGAGTGDIFRMVVREGIALSLAGLVLGVIGAVWLGQAGSSLLFGVPATDPITFIAVPLLVLAVAAIACVVPARRAMRVTPVAALQQRVE